jgi:hypothetical protein
MDKQGKFILFNKAEFQSWLFTNNFGRNINFVQNHHTYIPNYSHFNGSNYFGLLKGMESAHIERKFSQIGQNITIFPDGIIAVCRSFDLSPACIVGKNSGGLCIENLGDFDKNRDDMNAEHKESIIFTNAVLCMRFNLTPNTDRIVYHHWYHPKSCPGTNFFGGNTKQDAASNFIPLIKNNINKMNTKEPMKGIVNVKDDTLNVRGGPGTKFTIKRTLQKGEEVTILDSKNSWFKISDTKEEWVSAKFIKLV